MVVVVQVKPLNGVGGNLCGRTEHLNETFCHGAVTKARLINHTNKTNQYRREANLFAGVHLGNAEPFSLPDPFTSDAAPRSLGHSSLSTLYSLTARDVKPAWRSR